MRQGGVLSPILFALYIDSLIKELRASGYGTYIGTQFTGCILYADDITLLAGSCYGLQKMLDISTRYGNIWGIRFNPTKSQLMTFGGTNPIFTATLANASVVWCNSVKYLGVYYQSGRNVRIDLTAAKRKYYGCFNSILSITGKQMNEMIFLRLVSTYCLPKLMYACEVWPTEKSVIKEIDIIWNNAFRLIFNSCWHESVKPIQFFVSLCLYHIW